MHTSSVYLLFLLQEMKSSHTAQHKLMNSYILLHFLSEYPPLSPLLFWTISSVSICQNILSAPVISIPLDTSSILTITEAEKTDKFPHQNTNVNAIIKIEKYLQSFRHNLNLKIQILLSSFIFHKPFNLKGFLTTVKSNSFPSLFSLILAFVSFFPLKLKLKKLKSQAAVENGKVK